ncbi:SRPBCC family protein [Sphingosinicella terrae]|uniref:SRPBCC family protein n=1 Tax=Sphingosinicella terrae TaxID=2172047 RepID=UPI0013B36654|nr:SRPBCC family protein [Sphingosinicella terrae]
MPALADLFPRQVSCRRAVRLAVPAVVAWAVVGDIASLVPGGGMIERVDLEGEGAGAVRTFHLPGGARIVERIEEHDPVLRRYVYRIVDGGPLDCVDYLGLAQVTPAGTQACILSWAAMANPVAADADSLRKMLEANLDHALQAVADHVAGAVP